eukprot:TRINITY_DN2056_c0_g1_i2.p1 TRINITY_DN2056_c0_g1~~TRINITY_DN2056_c0_g1_i2.p1  ORF type:complete len:1476 (+),score=250.87 TRINITY_DN2056_c0_g1_i2:581-4429(+)
MAVACEGCSLADCRKSYLMDNSLELIWCCSELPIAVVFDHAHAQHLIVHVLLQPPQSVDLATPLVTDADTIAEIFIGPVTAPLFRDSNRSPRACRVLLATTYDNSPLVCWLRDSPGDLVGVKVDLAGNIAQQVFTIACCMSAVSLDMELLNFGQRKFILALTNSRKMQLFLENMPVSQYETPKDVTEVRDPVAGQFSLYASPSEHSLYRCTLRDMPQASLVKQCLSALAQCLTHNESITVLAAFCRTLRRGATGAGDPEWSTLQSLLCSACDSCGCGGGSESASGFGGSSAWEELLNSDYHLHMRRAPEMARLWQPSTRFAPLVSHWHEEECTAILKKHLPAIVEALHLLLQDLQLNTLCASSALLLARLLSCLASHLKWDSYVDYCWRYFPDACPRAAGGAGDRLPPDVFIWLRGRASQQRCTAMFPSLLPPLCWLTRKVTACYAQLSTPSWAERVVTTMVREGLGRAQLDELPLGVAFPLRAALLACRGNPPSDWSSTAYTLIGRNDLASLAQGGTARRVTTTKRSPSMAVPAEEADQASYSNDLVTSLIFSRDLRLKEVRRLLQSSARVVVDFSKVVASAQDPHAAQQAHMVVLAQRTLSLSVGRGMFELSECRPLATDPLRMPPLTLDCRTHDGHAAVLETQTVPGWAVTMLWPNFHNGAAAGLRLATSTSKITSTWVSYNKPDQQAETHAGFLLALGLRGQLALPLPKLHEYLNAGNELISIGLLLGMAAGKAGTMDNDTLKSIGIHLQALRPSEQIELPVNTQAAALVGLGLLYRNTAHRRTAEIALRQLGHLPTGCKPHDRESYSLAAGIAFGHIMLGRGADSAGLLADLDAASVLTAHLAGVWCSEERMGQGAGASTGTQLQGGNTFPYLVMDQDKCCGESAAAGAAVALCLTYLKTNNQVVASRLQIPANVTLGASRPDVVILRICGRALVLWDSIEATVEWVQQQVPKWAEEQRQLQEAARMRLCAIAGGCLAIGLKFAGSACTCAKRLLLGQLDGLTRHNSLPKTPSGNVTKAALHMCLNVVALSLGMVMCGTGDVEALAVLRRFHRATPDATYGDHMARHMAVGFLFMGGGKITLSTSNEAIAALLCACYPVFPKTTSDNFYHLQAFRHLYVLATECRCLCPVDVDTSLPCAVPVELTLSGPVVLCLTAPCLLPELRHIQTVKIASARHWRMSFGNDALLSAQSPSGIFVPVQRKTGGLPYAEGITRDADTDATHKIRDRRQQRAEPAGGTVVGPWRRRRRCAAVIRDRPRGECLLPSLCTVDPGPQSVY